MGEELFRIKTNKSHTVSVELFLDNRTIITTKYATTRGTKTNVYFLLFWIRAKRRVTQSNIFINSSKPSFCMGPTMAS